MAACEACWTEASRLAAYSAETVADLYPKVLAKHQEWSPEQPCGGLSTNGSTPVWCEAHMQPWKHREQHPHTTPTETKD